MPDLAYLQDLPVKTQDDTDFSYLEKLPITIDYTDMSYLQDLPIFDF